MFTLAIDIGTSGAKVLLLDPENHTLLTESASYATSSPAPGQAEQDPRDWYRAVCDAIPRLLRDSGVSPRDIACVGIDGVSWTPVLLDDKGRVLAPALLWYDTRSGKECEELRHLIGDERAFATSGNPLEPYYEDAKVRWFSSRHPDIMKKCRHILSSNGYIGYRLTGEIFQDECQAYGWLFFDMEKGIWDTALAEETGLDPALLPPVVPCHTLIGTVTNAAARETGLAAGTPVIAGGLDAAMGSLGAGVTEPGPLHEQSGSAGGMSIVTKDYRPAKGLILSRHVVPGRYLLQGGTVGGGQLMDWLIGVLAPGMEKSAARECLTREAARVPAGSDGLVFLPYMAGERSPIWDPLARGTFYGLDFTKTRGHIVRAVLEGACFALRHNLDAAKTAGAPMDALRAVGGASKNALWMQIKADITGLPICAVLSPHATALGCAVLAGAAIGVLPDTSVDAFISRGPAYEPDPSHAAVYEAAYQKYLSLYPRVAPLSKGV